MKIFDIKSIFFKMQIQNIVQIGVERSFLFPGQLDNSQQSLMKFRPYINDFSFLPSRKPVAEEQIFIKLPTADIILVVRFLFHGKTKKWV